MGYEDDNFVSGLFRKAPSLIGQGLQSLHSYFGASTGGPTESPWNVANQRRVGVASSNSALSRPGVMARTQGVQDFNPPAAAAVPSSAAGQMQFGMPSRGNFIAPSQHAPAAQPAAAPQPFTGGPPNYRAVLPVTSGRDMGDARAFVAAQNPTGQSGPGDPGGQLRQADPVGQMIQQHLAQQMALPMHGTGQPYSQSFQMAAPLPPTEYDYAVQPMVAHDKARAYAVSQGSGGPQFGTGYAPQAPQGPTGIERAIGLAMEHQQGQSQIGVNQAQAELLHHQSQLDKDMEHLSIDKSAAIDASRGNPIGTLHRGIEDQKTFGPYPAAMGLLSKPMGTATYDEAYGAANDDGQVNIGLLRQLLPRLGIDLGQARSGLDPSLFENIGGIFGASPNRDRIRKQQALQFLHPELYQ